MRVCFPVEGFAKEAGEDGIAVFGHFGSAPVFLLMDTETNDVKAVENANRSHPRGGCSPLSALNGERVDAVVTGGIGQGALNKLKGLGITVYRAAAPTVGENLKLLLKGELGVFNALNLCPGHGASGRCAHH